jgi:hypothetical protein
MLTGLRNGWAKNVQLNAGVFLMDVDYSKATDDASLRALIATAMNSPDKVLGATRGDGVFRCVPARRLIEANGARDTQKDGHVIDGWEIKLTTTLLEITPGNLAKALNCCDMATTEKVHTLTLRSEYKDTDYIPHLLWVGDTGYGLMLIDLHNALNIAGAVLTFTDKGEGTLPVEFAAHSENDEVPVTIKIFDK